MMNSTRRSLAALMIASLGTPVFAGSLERAPELPSVSDFHSALGGVAVPEAVEGVAAGVRGRGGVMPLACPVLDLQGATVARGIFQVDYRVKSGGKVLGIISSEDNGYLYKDFTGTTAAKSNGRGEVTDCGGTKIGSIEEEAGADASSFKIRNADGGLVAVTPAIDGDNMEFVDYAGKPVGWVIDGKISITDKLDPRMVAIAAVMNDAAAYRRSAQRRRDRMGDHPGRDR